MSNIDILPQNAIKDIVSVDNRILALVDSIRLLEDNNIDDLVADSVNNDLEKLRQQLQSLTVLQDRFNNSMSDKKNANINDINSFYNDLVSQVSSSERYIRDNSQLQNLLNPITSTPEPIPITWDIDPLNIDNYVNFGAERYEQEINSIATSLDRIISTQNSIAQNTLNMDILPDNAVQDIAILDSRILELSSNIQLLENNNIDDIVADSVNNDLEWLRQQLQSLTTLQNNLNSAFDNADITDINTAYSNLNTQVSSTERYIRDNTRLQDLMNSTINNGVDNTNSLVEQTQSVSDSISNNTRLNNNFNNSLSNSNTQLTGMMSTLSKIATTYLSIQSAGKLIELSDTVAQSSARLNNVSNNFGNDLDTTQLETMIFNASQNAGAEYSNMVDLVARFGNNASDAFSGSDSVVAFTDLLNKQMLIDGTTTAELSSTMIQLSQALGSGRLQGEEFNAIAEASPSLIQHIADSVGVAKGELKSMASEGVITADIVTSAIFEASDKINDNFNEFPKTWGQVWNNMKNQSVVSLEPVTTALSNVANNPAFQDFAISSVNALSMVAVVLESIINGMMDLGSTIADNWNSILPVIVLVTTGLIIYNTIVGISNLLTGQSTAAKIANIIITNAQTLATNIFNTSILTNIMLTGKMILIITGVCAVVGLAIAFFTSWADTTLSVTQIICGAIAVAGAIIYNIFITLFNGVIDIGVTLYNCIAAFANFFGSVFNNPVQAIAKLFYDLFDVIMGVIEASALAIDKLLKTDMSSVVSGIRNMIANNVGNLVAETEVIMTPVDASNYTKELIGISTAWEFGTGIGAKLEDYVGNLFDNDKSNLYDETPLDDDYTSLLGGSPLNDMTDFSDILGDTGGLGEIASNTGTIADNTSDIFDNIELSNEDLKYLRDAAEKDVINRFTTAEIKLEMNNNINNDSTKQDIDGFIDEFTHKINSAMFKMAEGAY